MWYNFCKLLIKKSFIMKRTNYLKIIVIVLFTSIISLAFTKLDDGDDFELIKNLEIYHSVMKQLRLDYVEEIKTAELISYSIKEMLKQLDPYTIYYPENLVEDYTFMNKGEFGGVGMTVVKINDKFIVTEILKDNPAYNSGIRIGDELIKIENLDLDNKSIDDISSLLKGETGAVVNVEILNQDKEEISHVLERVDIEQNNVSYSGIIDDNIGYIKLENFQINAGNEVQESFIELRKKNIDGLILDLRSNPGGLLIEAVKIVNIFVEKDVEVVRMQGKSIQSSNIFFTQSQPVDLEIPLVVLIDSHSASASEIVSGALQDLDRAVIVGQRSYGKGLVQLTKDLIYNTKMKVTIAKYFIPSGRCIQAHPSVTRNEDMSIAFVPDSVLVEYKTKIGRTVFDGAGIYPDVYIEELKKNEFIDSLTTNFVFFQFANIYHKNNNEIDDASNFVVSDEILESFFKYLNENYSYVSSLENEIEGIRTNKLDTDYYEINNKLEAIIKEIKIIENKKNRELDNELKFLLGKEIIKHFYYKDGVIEYDIKNCFEVIKSKEIINNIEYYNDLIKL